MSRKFLALCFTAIALTACAGGDSTAPLVRASHDSPLDSKSGTSLSDGGTTTQAPQPLQCSVPEQLTGSATIGTSGGVLHVGPHYLIVPPGALKSTMNISGTVDAGTSVVMRLAPEGLEFKKSATLVLSLSGCTLPPTALFVDYLSDSGQLLQRIQTLFTTWFGVIAAPIEHFSIYALDV
jgi:hypothetical protein